MAMSNARGYDTMLTDRQNMSFMVNVQKWLRENFRQQTYEVLASYPPTGVHTSKMQKLNDPKSVKIASFLSPSLQRPELLSRLGTMASHQSLTFCFHKLIVTN